MNANQLIKIIDRLQQQEDDLGGDGDELKVYCRTCGGYFMVAHCETDESGKKRISLIHSEPGKIYKTQDANELRELLEGMQRWENYDLRVYCQNCESYVQDAALEAAENGERQIVLYVKPTVADPGGESPVEDVESEGSAE